VDGGEPTNLAVVSARLDSPVLIACYDRKGPWRVHRGGDSGGGPL